MLNARIYVVMSYYNIEIGRGDSEEMTQRHLGHDIFIHYILQMIVTKNTITTPILVTACFTMYFDVCEGSRRDMSRDASGFIAIYLHVVP